MENQGALLSRDELSALLQSLEESRTESERNAKLTEAGCPPVDRKLARRELDAFGARFAKQLSSTYQRLVDLSLLEFTALTFTDLSEILRPQDEVALFSCDSGATGIIFLNEAFFSEWFFLSLGSAAPATLPDRPYTPIEKRFLRKYAADCLAQLRVCAPTLLPTGAEICSIEGAASLADHGNGAVLWASFDAKGMGGLARLRIALPIETAGRPEAVPSRGGDPAQIETLMNTPVSVHAELGSTALSLQRLAALCVGDVIPIESGSEGRLAIRVEGAHKFDAVRGTVGQRLAVRIIERIRAQEDPHERI